MADAVTNLTTQQDTTSLYIHLTCISDATGETAAIKVTKANLVGITGAAPLKLSISIVRWAVQGFTSVRLLFDHAVDDVGMVLSGNGYDEFTAGNAAILDPASAGGTGDLLLTSVGAVAGATYDITLRVGKVG